VCHKQKLKSIGKSAYICLYEVEETSTQRSDPLPSHGSPPADNAPRIPRYRVQDNDGRLALFIVGADGVERQQLCYAPVGAYVPQHIHDLLPARFLQSAVVDNYVAESCLLDYSRDTFQDTIVNPGLHVAKAVNYCAISSAARAVKTAVPDELFLVMLDLEIIADLEGQWATTFRWSD